MADNSWVDPLFPVEQARAARQAQQIAASQYLSPNEMSKMWVDTAVFGHSCLQQAAIGEVKHVSWSEMLIADPTSTEQTAVRERDKLLEIYKALCERHAALRDELLVAHDRLAFLEGFYREAGDLVRSNAAPAGDFTRVSGGDPRRMGWVSNR